MLRLISAAILVLVGLIPIAAPRAAQAPREEVAFEDVFTGFKFPKVLGAYRFQNRAQGPHVDLGYGLNYGDATGAATIVVYDLNLRDIANGTEDPRVLEELKKAEAAIATFAQQSGYRSVNRVETPQLSKAWLQQSYELIRPDGRKAYAYSFLRAQGGRFIKIRITSSFQGTFARLPVFLLGVSRAIGMLNRSE